MQQPYFSIYITGACAAYERKRDSLHPLQLSQYSELIMTSLGARYITEKMREYGIRRMSTSSSLITAQLAIAWGGTNPTSSRCRPSGRFGWDVGQTRATLASPAC